MLKHAHYRITRVWRYRDGVVRLIGREVFFMFWDQFMARHLVSFLHITLPLITLGTLPHVMWHVSKTKIFYYLTINPTLNVETIQNPNY